MSDQEREELISLCLEWLREGFAVQDLGGAYEVTTPFLDRRNDHIQIYVRKQNDGFIISDEGNTVSEMEESGFNLNLDSKNKLLIHTIHGYGVNQDNKVLRLEAEQSNLGQRMNFMIQAIMALNNIMPVPAVPVKSLMSSFRRRVIGALSAQGFQHQSKVPALGISGYKHEMETITRLNEPPTTLFFKEFYSPDRRSVSRFLFKLNDIKDSDPRIKKSAAVLNDEEKQVNSRELEALDQYGVVTAHWSQREEFSKLLA